MHDGDDVSEWWTFWGGPACGERQQRVAASFAPADRDGAPPEHLRIVSQFDAARGSTVVLVHQYLAAPWPPPPVPTEFHWRYAGVTIDEPHGA